MAATEATGQAARQVGPGRWSGAGRQHSKPDAVRGSVEEAEPWPRAWAQGVRRACGNVTWTEAPRGRGGHPPGGARPALPCPRADSAACCRLRATSAGLKDWEKRLIISDRAHLGEFQTPLPCEQGTLRPGAPPGLLPAFWGAGRRDHCPTGRQGT